MHSKIIVLLLVLNNFIFAKHNHNYTLPLNFASAICKTDIGAIEIYAKKGADLNQLIGSSSPLDYLQNRYVHYDKRASYFRHLNIHRYKKYMSNREETGQCMHKLISLASKKLHDAVITNNLKDAVLALNAGASITDEILHLTMSKDLSDLLNVSLDIIDAVQNQNLKKVQELIKKNPNLCATDKNGFTAMWHANNRRHHFQRYFNHNKAKLIGTEVVMAIVTVASCGALAPVTVPSGATAGGVLGSKLHRIKKTIKLAKDINNILGAHNAKTYF